MKPEISDYLDSVVRKSLASKDEGEFEWSITECANNRYLDPEYDPFKILEFELMAKTVRQKYGITGGDDD